MGRKTWSEIKQTAAPDVRQKGELRARRILAGMELDELRRKVGLTQSELAAKLGTHQPNVSKLERRGDMLVSTLRDTVEAMEGGLEVYARFGEKLYRLNQFCTRQAWAGILTERQTYFSNAHAPGQVATTDLSLGDSRLAWAKGKSGAIKQKVIVKTVDRSGNQEITTTASEDKSKVNDDMALVA